MYDLYKPLRNYLRKIDVHSALLAMWAYSRHIEYGSSLPPSLVLQRPFDDMRGKVFLFQIHLMTREVILNCSLTGGEEFTGRTMSQTWNHINRIGEEISKARYAHDSDSDRVLRDLIPLVHQQIPHRSTLDIPRLLRYTRVFGNDAIGPILERRLGLNIVECYILILIVVSGLQRTPFVNSEQNLDEFGISPDRSKVFFNWLSQSLSTTREVLSENQVYDANWAYTWNSLEERPLIILNESVPSQMLCPNPALLWQKFSSGLYFELVKDSDFGNHYGKAFEEHVGEFAQRTLPIDRFAVYREAEYHVGKERKDGLDWFITDDTANLFVECKTKRLRQGAKLVDAAMLLTADLEVLANAVLQGYKNIVDVFDGKTAWLPAEKPSFLAITTLEDWLLFSPQIKLELHQSIERKLVKQHLDLTLLHRIPYVVLSCHEFELMVIAAKYAGLFVILNSKSSGEFKDWQMNEFLQRNFKKELLEGFEGAYRQGRKDLMKTVSRNWRDDIRLKTESTINRLG